MVNLVDITKKFSEEERAQDRALAAMFMYWAKKAERGELSTVAIAAVCKNNTVDTEVSGSDNHIMLIAAGAILQDRIMSAKNSVVMEPVDG